MQEGGEGLGEMLAEGRSGVAETVVSLKNEEFVVNL